jgi:hypothetical protein
LINLLIKKLFPSIDYIYGTTFFSRLEPMVPPVVTKAASALVIGLLLDGKGVKGVVAADSIGIEILIILN